MKEHHRLSPDEMAARRLSLNRVAPYVIGTSLPLPIFMLVGFVLRDIKHVQVGDFSIVIAWITTMTIGLVCSVQSCRLAPNLSIGLLGAIFVVVYLSGLVVLLGFVAML